MLKLLYDSFFFICIITSAPQKKSYKKNEHKAIGTRRQSQSISNKICGYIYFALAQKKENIIIYLNSMAKAHR